jgi:hypothetical protein
MWRLPKCFQQRRQGSFGGARTLGMTAHPIDDDQKHGLFRSRHGHSVLILFAMANETDIRGLDLQ